MEIQELIPVVSAASFKKRFCKYAPNGGGGQNVSFPIYLHISKENRDMDTVFALKCNKNESLKNNFRNFLYSSQIFCKKLKTEYITLNYSIDSPKAEYFVMFCNTNSFVQNCSARLTHNFSLHLNRIQNCSAARTSVLRRMSQISQYSAFGLYTIIVHLLFQLSI